MKLLIPMTLTLSTMFAFADEHYEIEGTRSFTEVVEFTPKSEPTITCVLVKGSQTVALECFPRKTVPQRVPAEVEM